MHRGAVRRSGDMCVRADHLMASLLMISPQQLRLRGASRARNADGVAVAILRLVGRVR
jgi:hypothetical protein